jgi:hypothetical protein
MDSRLRQGYLLLADISGYTAFLTGNELLHAQGILEDLTRCILKQLGPPLRLVKLEGDAAFCYAPAESFASGERLLEAIEACYCAFCDHKDDMQRQTTCECNACANIGTLDLKFLAHFGEFVVQRVGGTEDLAGPSVILIHRLLKNRVSEATGVKAYAFLTEAALARLPQQLPLPEHSENFDVGEVRGQVLDLAPCFAALRSARRVFVEPRQSDLSVDIAVPAPVPVAWDWWMTPALCVQWNPGLTGWEDHPNEAGRMGIGAEGHCAHGNTRSIQRYLDIRPFHYLTTESHPLKRSLSFPATLNTAEFEEKPDGTSVIHFRARLTEAGPLTRLLAHLVIAPMFKRQFRQAERKLAVLLGEASDSTASGAGPA